MISLLEAISPTARQCLNPDLVQGLPHETTAAALLAGKEQYQWLVKAHYYCGTNVARCDGFAASSTNSLEVAAAAAAVKRFKKYCAIMQLDPGQYTCQVAHKQDNLYIATFTKRKKS